MRRQVRRGFSLYALVCSRFVKATASPSPEAIRRSNERIGARSLVGRSVHFDEGTATVRRWSHVKCFLGSVATS